MGSGSIPDAAITASSEASPTNSPGYGRLNSSGWCALDADIKPWISVDLGKIVTVTGVETHGQRCNNCHRWVTLFSVDYMDSNGNWTSVDQVRI